MSKESSEPVSLKPIVTSIEEVIERLQLEAARESQLIQLEDTATSTAESAAASAQPDQSVSRRVLEIRANVLQLEAICNEIKIICLSEDSDKAHLVRCYD